MPQQAGVSAGREVLRRTAEYIRNEESFAIETTLAGGWTKSAIRPARERSFFTRLFYICLDNPERSIQRVRERVAQGGHDVPDADVRRRYTRSLGNAVQVLQLVHQGLVFDNSGAEPRPIFEMRGGASGRSNRRDSRMGDRLTAEEHQAGGNERRRKRVSRS
jgi:predicted ABC-type ATPase